MTDRIPEGRIVAGDQASVEAFGFVEETGE
jgi:hypothetical protein